MVSHGRLRYSQARRQHELVVAALAAWQEDVDSQDHPEGTVDLGPARKMGLEQNLSQVFDKVSGKSEANSQRLQRGKKKTSIREIIQKVR